MTNTKHTRGPWQIRNTARGFEVKGQPSSGMSTGSVLEAGLIARTFDSSSIDEANALLIAAAPDLLAACEALVREAEHVDEDEYTPRCPVMRYCNEPCMCWVGEPLRLATAAIAKAKGEK